MIYRFSHRGDFRVKLFMPRWSRDQFWISVQKISKFPSFAKRLRPVHQPQTRDDIWATKGEEGRCCWSSWRNGTSNGDGDGNSNGRGSVGNRWPVCCKRPQLRTLHNTNSTEKGGPAGNALPAIANAQRNVSDRNVGLECGVWMCWWW